MKQTATRVSCVSISLRILGLALLAAWPALAPAQAGAAESKGLISVPAEPPGMKPLFDGQSLAGWDGDPRLWSVKDGVIRGETTDQVKTRGNTFLIWKGGEVEDFDLRLSFRVSTSNNSGIQYRSRHLPFKDSDTNRWAVGGYQAEVRNQPGLAGFIYDERGKRGRMCLVGEKAAWTAQGKKLLGSVGDKEAIAATFKTDDWNEYVIIAQGPHIRHYLNGVQTIDFTDEDEVNRRLSGIVALQIHAGAPMWVEFKNVRLKQISTAAQPLRALLITGGCCHDYPRQKDILPQGVSARANVEWTVVQDPRTGTQGKIEIYKNDRWAEGYDVVVHNECFADEKEVEWLERIVKPHREGVPAVLIHCTMHCYRAPTDEWFQFCGVTSHRHGSHFAYGCKNANPEHPIMKGFPATWQTPKEELYHIAKLWPTATPLATGYSPETKRDEVNIWVNTYGQGRVFGTTIGHYNQTMEAPEFLDVLTRGLLWACGKLGEDGTPLAGYGPKPAQ